MKINVNKSKGILHLFTAPKSQRQDWRSNWRRRRMRLGLFNQARCSSVSYGRIVIVVKALLLCVNRPWFLSFLCFSSCHFLSLSLSRRWEFIELNEWSSSVVIRIDSSQNEGRKHYLSNSDILSWHTEIYFKDISLARKSRDSLLVKDNDDN